jgi:abortive infection bacteriophage resistance protein
MLDNKPPLTISDQLALLLQRGMSVPDPVTAKRFLTNVSYYRLKGYWWDDQADQTNHRFKAGSDFNVVVDRYNFDRELRLITLNMIERVEVGLRTRVAYTFSHNHGPHWFADVQHFKDRRTWSGHLQAMRREVDQSKEIFIKAHLDKYGRTDSRLPSAWKTLEVLSLGMLSKLFTSIDNGTRGKRQIASDLGLNNVDVLESWLQLITILRNVCAHHGRLYGRPLPLQMRLLKSPILPWLKKEHLRGDDAKSTYAVLCACQYLLQSISPQNRFSGRIQQLLNDYPTVDANQIGLPANWQNQPLWQ